MKVWPVKHSPLLCQPERFIARNELQALIQKVTHNLVNIQDKSGQFLLRLDDGRIIDTKGWNGWEWTHGVGLYGIYQYYQQTGDIAMRDIIDSWFADRFAEGATTKNVNTMAPFLTLAYRMRRRVILRIYPGLIAGQSGRCAICRVLSLAACSTSPWRKRTISKCGTTR